MNKIEPIFEWHPTRQEAEAKMRTLEETGEYEGLYLICGIVPWDPYVVAHSEACWSQRDKKRDKGYTICGVHKLNEPIL